LVTKRLLTTRQRAAIENYIDTMPISMPQYLRSLKNIIKGVDLDQMQKDLELIRVFMSIEIKIGRKPASWHADLKNVMNIRQRAAADVRASFRVEKKTQ